MDMEKIPRRANPGWWVAILGVLILIGLVGIGAWSYFQSKLDRINYTGNEVAEEEWKNEDGTKASGIAALEYLNILLLGTDERAVGGTSEDFETGLQEGARADACMLLSLNLKKHTARLVSLERSIGVEIEGAPGGEDWLTQAFAFGGADAMLRAVRDQFEIDVRRYARVNVSSASQLIDAIGGVDITLTEQEAAALNGEIPTNSTTRHPVKPGLNHLDGFDALAYGRQRLIDSDYVRVQRQRNVLQAAINQTKSLNLKEIDALLNVALPLVETNFTKKEITSLVPKAPGFLGVQLKQMTMPLKGMAGSKLTDDGRSMTMLDHEEAVRIMHEFLYGDFDPAEYEVSREVVNRIWQKQQKDYAEWAAAHPEAFASSSEDEDMDAEESEDEEDTRDDKERAEDAKKKKTSPKKDRSEQADRDSSKNADEEPDDRARSASRSGRD